MVKVYSARLVLRIAVFTAGISIYLTDRNSLLLSGGLSLDHGIKPLHILWLILASGMIQKLFPLPVMSMGCRKQFKSSYAPGAREPGDPELSAWAKGENRAARKVLAAWLSVNAAPAVLYFAGVLGESEMVLLSLVYYACDPICLLFYCPFQSFLMKNRCCVTCRIFNWDSMMILTPLIVIPSPFSWSLILFALIILIRWEMAFQRHPRRFWEESNQNLQCAHCRERICRVKRSLPQ